MAGAMKVCKILNIAGAVVGYVGAMAVGMTGALSHERTVPVMLLLLTVALFCGCALVTRHHRRPIRLAFDLGYEARRRDEIREANQRLRAVQPVRRLTPFDIRETVRL